jgi:hypothetical protein
MICHVLWENENVIDVAHHKIIQVFTKHIIHQVLENNRCVGKAKGHHNIFKMVVMSFDYHLPFITFSNAHQSVCSSRLILVYILAWLRILRSKVKCIGSWWWVNLVHNNQHTCVKIHPFSWQIGLEHWLETWNVEWTYFQDFHRCILKMPRIRHAISYRWSKWGLRSFLQINHTIIWPMFR